ncbi:MAG: chemotaxis protein CheB [Chitinophagaceae bacterium]
MKGQYDMLVIGGSAGSLEVILHMLPRLKPDFNVPMIIVMHRNRTNETRLINLLATRTKLRVKEAEEKETIVSGTIYIAPPDYHLLIEKNHSFSLDDSERIHHSRPSIDVTFESASLAYGTAVVCILLSGANADGAESLRLIKQRGGLTVAQNPQSAEQGYMPQQAINLFPVDLILDKEDIADILNEL